MASLKPQYIVQVQKPYLCNVACLNMILYRQCGKIFEQEEMADFFNVKIHPNLTSCFSKKFKTTDKINDDEGLKTIEEEKKINQFLKKNNLTLQAKSYYLSDILNIRTLKNFIQEHINKNNDLWIEYKLEGLFPGNRGIHDGLIESVSGDQVIIINPGYDTPNRYTFSIVDIQEAISDKYARETGIIVISKK